MRERDIVKITGEVREEPMEIVGEYRETRGEREVRLDREWI